MTWVPSDTDTVLPAALSFHKKVFIHIKGPFALDNPIPAVNHFSFYPQNQISKKMQEFMKRNEDISRDVCNDLLKNLSLTMQNGLMHGRYSRPGGHKLFLLDKLQFLEKYHRMPGKGVKSLEVLENFMRENKNIEAAILKAEEKIAEAEGRLAESYTQSMQAQWRRQSVEQQNRDLQQSVNQQSADHQQHLNSLTEMMEQNRGRMNQENASLISRRLQEQQFRLSSSHQQSLDELLRTIEELKRQNSQRHSSGGGGGGCILC